MTGDGCGGADDAGFRFKADVFEASALRCGHPLGDAAMMLSQPVSYGIDAGRAVDEEGKFIAASALASAVRDEDWRKCAVLVSIVAREPQATVLLTQRTAQLKSHAGQIAFAGGKIEPDDPTAVDAALREAQEEIGLPRHMARPLSLLDLHKTGTGFRIVPVIAMIDPVFTPKPDAAEVDDVFEVPLSFLMNERNHQRHYAEWKGQRRLFYAMTYRTRFVWGATAAILRNLYERLYASWPASS